MEVIENWIRLPNGTWILEEDYVAVQEKILGNFAFEFSVSDDDNGGICE